MVKIKLEMQAKDEHALITKLECLQWDIAGGATEGEGWKIENDNSNSKD